MRCVETTVRLYPKLYPLPVGMGVIQYENPIVRDCEYGPEFTTPTHIVRLHTEAAGRDC